MAFQFNLGVQFKQDAAPTNKVYGDRWYDTINEECFEWTEGSPDSWVSCIPVGENAYIAGGTTGATTYLSTIESFNFPFSSNAVQVGNLSATRRFSQGFNSSTHGYFAGGQNVSTDLSSIDRITFPFESGTASNVGTLSTLSHNFGACNDSEHGYVFCGGIYLGSDRSSYSERISFPFDSCLKYQSSI